MTLPWLPSPSRLHDSPPVSVSAVPECREPWTRSTLFLLPLFIFPHAPIPIPFALYSTVFATLSCTTPLHVRLRVYSPHAPSLAAPYRWWGSAAPFAILSLFARTFIRAEHLLAYPSRSTSSVDIGIFVSSCFPVVTYSLSFVVDVICYLLLRTGPETAPPSARANLVPDRDLRTPPGLLTIRRCLHIALVSVSWVPPGGHK